MLVDLMDTMMHSGKCSGCDAANLRVDSGRVCERSLRTWLSNDVLAIFTGRYRVPKLQWNENIFLTLVTKLSMRFEIFGT